MTWHEAYVCVPLSFVSVLTSDCFRSLPARAHYCLAVAELREPVPVAGSCSCWLLSLIEQNHTVAPRVCRSEWKAWHAGLKVSPFFLKTVKYFSPQCWGDAAGVSGQHSTLGALNIMFSSSLLMALNKSVHLSVPVLPPWVLRLRNQDIWKGTVSDYSFIACSAHRCLGFQ